MLRLLSKTSAFSLALCISQALAQSAPRPVDLNDPAQLLAAAREKNGLDGDDLKPWHLKATYTLLDDDGKSLGNGVFEEWWLSKDMWKRTYTGSHYSGATYRTKDGFAQEGGRLLWPETLIAQSVIDPIPKDSTGTLQVSFAKLRKESTPPLSCIEVTRTSDQPGDPADSFCFDAGTTDLRVASSHSVAAFYGRLGRFQGRAIGVETTVQVNSHPLLKVHIESLASDPAMQQDVVQAPASLVFSPDYRPNATPNTTPPKFISGEDPESPAGSNQQSGIAVLEIVVDERGKVRDVHVLESPDSGMAEATSQAVRHWKFKPGERDGKPVQVEINVEVNFHPRGR